MLNLFNYSGSFFYKEEFNNQQDTAVMKISCSEVKWLSCVWLFATPWTVARQAPPSMGFSRQEYWNGLPFPSPGDLPNPGIELMSPALQADALTSEPPGKQEVKLGLKSSSPNSPLSVLSTILVSANLPDHDNHLLSTSGIGPRWVLRWTRQIWERPSLHRVT